MDTAIVTAGAAITGVVVGALFANFRDRRADLRSLRDQRVSRLRAAFGPVLRHSLMVIEVMVERTHPEEGESATAHLAFMRRRMREASVGVEDARVALQLENGAGVAGIERHLGAVNNALTAYGAAVLVTPQDFTLPQLSDAQNRLKDSVVELRKEMLQVLDDAEQPIPMGPWHGLRRIVGGN